MVVLGLSGINNALISLFLSFKAIKAKKAAILAGKAKLQMQKFVEPKILLQDPEELFKLPLTQNRAGSWKLGLLKAKMYPEGCKIEEYPKILLNGPNTLSKYINLSFKNFLDILQFCDLLGTFWPLKGPTFKILPYFELEVV